MTSVPAMVCVVERGCCVLGAAAVAAAVDDDGGVCDCDSCFLMAVVDRDRWDNPTLNRANWGTNVAMLEVEGAVVRPVMEVRRGCIARRTLLGAIFVRRLRNSTYRKELIGVW